MEQTCGTGRGTSDLCRFRFLGLQTSHAGSNDAFLPGNKNNLEARRKRTEIITRRGKMGQAGGTGRGTSDLFRFRILGFPTSHADSNSTFLPDNKKKKKKP